MAHVIHESISAINVTRVEMAEKKANYQQINCKFKCIEL